MCLPRIWKLQCFGEERHHRGHLGYRDELRRSYGYDSFVPNCKQLRVGDVACLENKEGVVGFARIREIRSAPGRKVHKRCPACKLTNIAQRKNAVHLYRCQKCGCEFDEPNTSRDECVRYEALLGNVFVDVTFPFDRGAIRACCLRYAGQLAIQELNLSGILRLLPEDAADMLRALVLLKMESPVVTGAGPELE